MTTQDYSVLWVAVVGVAFAIKFYFGKPVESETLETVEPSIPTDFQGHSGNMWSKVPLNRKSLADMGRDMNGAPIEKVEKKKHSTYTYKDRCHCKSAQWPHEKGSKGCLYGEAVQSPILFNRASDAEHD